MSLAMNLPRTGIILSSALIGAVLSSMIMSGLAHTVTSTFAALMSVGMLCGIAGVTWCLSAERAAIDLQTDRAVSEAESWMREKMLPARVAEVRKPPLPADVLALYDRLADKINRIREDFGEVTKLASTAKLNAADAYDQLAHKDRRIGALEVYASAFENALAPLSGMKPPLPAPHPFRRTDALRHVDSIMAPLQAAIEKHGETVP